MSSSAATRVAEEIRRDLFSGDDTVVLKALHRCREEGNASLVGAVISLYATTKSAQIRREAGDMLGTLKVSGAWPAFSEALQREEFKKIRKDLLSFTWNSGIQPVEELGLVTSIAVNGSLEEAIECLTILESIDTTVPEEQLLDSINQIRQYLNGQVPDNKKELIKIYLGVLQGLEE